MSTSFMRLLTGRKVQLCASALLVLTIGCAKKTDTTTTDSTSTTADTSHPVATVDTAAHPPTYTDANMMALMTEADSAEVTEAKAVLGKTKNADVKALANMMITDHTKMLKEDHELAAKTNTTPQPPAQDPTPGDLTRVLSQINSATDPKMLDNMYASNAVEDHQKDLNSLKMFQEQAQNADLKAAITKALPIVQKHLDHAQAVQSKLTGAPISTDTTKVTHTMKKK